MSQKVIDQTFVPFIVTSHTILGQDEISVRIESLCGGMVRSQQGSNYFYTRYETAFCYQLREKVGLLGSFIGSLPFMRKRESAITEISHRNFTLGCKFDSKVHTVFQSPTQWDKYNLLLTKIRTL